MDHTIRHNALQYGQSWCVCVFTCIRIFPWKDIISKCSSNLYSLINKDLGLGRYLSCWKACYINMRVWVWSLALHKPLNLWCMLVTPALGGQRQADPPAHWPASPASSEDPIRDPVRGPVSRTKQMYIGEQHQKIDHWFPHACVCMCTHDAYPLKHTNINWDLLSIRAFILGQIIFVVCARKGGELSL